MTTDKSNMSIAIVGGGLGGVTAAIALGRAGYQGMYPPRSSYFGVIEPICFQYTSSSKAQSSPSLDSASASARSKRSLVSILLPCLTIAPRSSLRAFELLGVMDTFRAVAELRPAGSGWAHYLAHEDSAEVADVRFAGQAAFMHRKRVLEALVARLPPNVCTHFSARIVGVSDVAGGARVRLEVAPATDTSSTGGCADGIKSAIRATVAPDARVRWTGTYGYRHLVPMQAVRDVLGPLAQECCIWMAPDRVRTRARSRGTAHAARSTWSRSRSRRARSSASSRTWATGPSRWPSACGTGRGCGPATARRCWASLPGGTSACSGCSRSVRRLRLPAIPHG
jgi:salicylate hydroxylase